MKILAFVFLFLLANYSVGAQDFLSLLKAVSAESAPFQPAVEEQAARFMAEEFATYSYKNFKALYQHKNNVELPVIEMGLYQKDELKTTVHQLFGDEQPADVQKNLKLFYEYTALAEKGRPFEDETDRKTRIIEDCNEVITALREEYDRMKAGSGDAVSGELDFVTRSVSKSSLPLELQSPITLDKEPKDRYFERINRYLAAVNKHKEQAILDRQPSQSKFKEIEEQKKLFLTLNPIIDKVVKDGSLVPLIEASVEKKYASWYAAELKTISARLPTKFPGLKPFQVRTICRLMNEVDTYIKEMEMYDQLKKSEGADMTDVMIKSLASVSTNEKYGKLYRAIQNAVAYSEKMNAAYPMFEEYTMGTYSENFAYIVDIRNATSTASQPIEKTIEAIEDMNNVEFEEITEPAGALLSGFTFDAIMVSKIGSYYNKGIDQVSSRKIIVKYMRDEFDADDLLIFNDVKDIKQVELQCNCKVKSLSKYQSQFKFEFKKL